jgi:hypothetical protein
VTDPDLGLVDRWASEAWQAEVTVWVDEQLAATTRTRSGPFEQVRIRPWGAVLRAPTSEGTVFMKATAPSTSFEASLYDLLVRVVPERVLHPIALDVDAGWLLLPDGGRVLSDQQEGDALVELLEGVAGQYGQLQVDLSGRVDELLAMNVVDMRPAAMVARFDEALAVARRCPSDGRADRIEALESVAGMQATFASWCERLVAAPGAPTLDHNDLHGGNVFLTEAGEARFFDWGDAVVAHPFASALVLRSVVRWILDVHEETPKERRVLDAYLEPFTVVAPRAELREVVDVACEVGKVARALVWARAVALLPADADDPDGFAFAPRDWMLELLDGPLAAEAARA